MNIYLLCFFKKNRNSYFDCSKKKTNDKIHHIVDEFLCF